MVQGTEGPASGPGGGCASLLRCVLVAHGRRHGRVAKAALWNIVTRLSRASTLAQLAESPLGLPDD